MNFYVTLPSNGADLSTEEARINNTQTDFTIKLNKPLEFNIPYEVALAEIWYSVNWKVLATKIKIFYDDQDVLLIDSDFVLTDGMKLNHVFRKINNIIEAEVNKIDFDKLITEINKKRADSIKKLIGSHFKEEEFSLIQLDDVKKLLSLIKFKDSVGNTQTIFINVIVPDGLRLEMTGYLPTVLTQWLSIKPDHKDQDRHFNLRKQNIKNNQDFLSIKGDDKISFKFILNNNQLRVIGELYLYTDIINYQYIGSQMRKLLRVITVNKNADTVNHMSFSDLHYLPVTMNRVDSIQLKLADDQGQPIRFGDETSRVIYTLHFRPINKK